MAMDHLNAADMAEIVKHLTRDADILLALQISEVILIFKLTVYGTLWFLLIMYDLYNGGLSIDFR